MVDGPGFIVRLIPRAGFVLSGLKDFSRISECGQTGAAAYVGIHKIRVRVVCWVSGVKPLLGAEPMESILRELRVTAS